MPDEISYDSAVGPSSVNPSELCVISDFKFSTRSKTDDEVVAEGSKNKKTKINHSAVNGKFVIGNYYTVNKSLVELM